MESIFANLNQYSKKYVQNQDNNNRQEGKSVSTKIPRLRIQIQNGYLQAKLNRLYQRL